MSTLLTPIVTQLELDRDRFNSLVNGDETVTVELETRTEKSIAGQVKDRIDAMAISLTDAVNRSEDAQSNAEAAQSDAETARDEAKSHRDDAFNSQAAAEAARDASQTYRSETETFYNQTDALYSGIMNAASIVTAAESNVDALASQVSMNKDVTSIARNEALAARDEASRYASQLGDAFIADLAASPKMAFPTSMVMVDVTQPIPLVGTAPILFSDKVKFSMREFVVEEYDDSASSWAAFNTYTSMNYSYTIPADELDDTKQYRWQIVDVLASVEANPLLSYRTSPTEWMEISFDQPPAPQPQNRVDIDVITKPTVTIEDSATESTPILKGDGFFATSATHRATVWLVVDAETQIPVYQKTSTTDLVSHSVESGYLLAGRTYKATCRYIGDFNSHSQSEWADFAEFTFAPTTHHLGTYSTNSIEITDVIDVTGATVNRLDGTTDAVLSLSHPTLPSTISQSIVIFIEGSGGSITWSSEVSWAGGNEPELGTTWTNIVLFWTGTMWIGMESAKQ